MPGRRIVVAGGTGFIGERLVRALVTAGEEVVVLSRGGTAPTGARLVVWDARSAGDWAKELDGAYAVVNLAGEPVGQKWTPATRERIRESRLKSVEAICNGISSAANPPRRWINASAIGFYDNRGAAEVDESSPAGDGFLADVCIAWEDSVRRCPCPATAKTLVRIGLVLGDGGALPTLAKLSRLGLGGAAGSGTQAVSWIHIDDLVGIISWLLDLGRPPEVVNATAPTPTSNADLMRRIRRVVRAPFGLPAPAFGARLVGKMVGPDAELILGGVRALPREAVRLGYSYVYPNLTEALEDLLARD